MRMRIVRLFICLFILMMINACKPFYSQKSSPNDVIKIGFAYPYELDQEIKKSKGLFMAVKEMNAKGGIKGKKIVVTAIDDYGTVTGGLKAAHHLIADQNVLAVSGHYNSRVAKAVIPLYQKSGVPFITSGVTSPNLFKEKQSFIFRNIPNDKLVIEQMFKHIQSLNIRNIAVFYADDEFGQGVANSVTDLSEKYKLQLIDKTSEINLNNIDYLLKRWEALDCEAVVIGDIFHKAKDIVAYIHQKRPDLILISTSSFNFTGVESIFEQNSVLQTSSLQKNPATSKMLVERNTNRLQKNSDVNILIPTHFNYLSNDEMIKSFILRYKQLYREEPNFFSVLAYDSTMLIMKAMENCKEINRENIAAELSAIKNYNGISGHLTCQYNGEFTGNNIYLLTIKNGKLCLIDQ